MIQTAHDTGFYKSCMVKCLPIDNNSKVSVSYMIKNIYIRGGGWTGNAHITQVQTYRAIHVTLVEEIIIHLRVVFVKYVWLMVVRTHI